MTQFSVENPTDEIHTITLVTQYLCIPIISFFVLMRFSIRTWYKQPFTVEDGACYVAWILFMAYCAIAIIMAQNGAGYHLSDITDEQAIQFRKWSYIATVIYCPMALIVKIALLSILIRIFGPYKTKVTLIYVFLGALCIYYTIAEVIKIRMCDPVPAFWLGPTGPGVKCFDQAAALLADSVISVVSDLIILIVPLPLTWSLQMSRNKKLRVMGMLSAGGLATAFSIYRLVLVVKDGQSMDQTIVFTCVVLSGNAEGGVGIICACLPAVNIVIAKLRKYGSSYNRSYGHQDSSVPLSKMRKGASKGQSKASKNDPEGTLTDYENDQSHLISYAGSAQGGRGIHKTIDVSQTVEMLDERDERNSSSHS
ncbi:hypothetical protein SI65_09944 [Aspergillus cristatus]|uniref:Rhodopsin domain-containing protein n=1 Tax=Aspergillus cristatus TaxID=573508 RepID=A0A1E3B107_ASPCR|nr:hypothetical protein SI65_09944 [Aspergillus cristatus]